jgi:hypothetical protein
MNLGIVHGKISYAEDMANFAGPKYEDVARKAPTYDQLQAMHKFTKRVKLANRSDATLGA